MSAKISSIIWFLATNVATTLFAKLQNRQLVQEGPHLKRFFHPFMHAWTMFLGMALCCFAYYYRKSKQPKSEDISAPSKPKAKISVYLILVVLDLVTSTLSYCSLNFLTGSTFSISKGGVIIVTAFFSKVFLKRVIVRQQWVGCGLTLVGIIIAGVGDSLDSQGESDIEKLLIGLSLLIASVVVQGFYFVFNERAYEKYDVTPLQIVAFEGLLGLILWSMIVPILGVTPCPFGIDPCTFDNDGNAYLERADIFLDEFLSNQLILAFTVCYTLAIPIFNLALGQVIKSTSAFALVLLYISSNSLIWMVGVALTYSFSENTEFELQSLSLVKNGVKLLGFVITILGTLVYNKLICYKQTVDMRESSNSILLGQNEDESSK